MPAGTIQVTLLGIDKTPTGKSKPIAVLSQQIIPPSAPTVQSIGSAASAGAKKLSKAFAKNGIAAVLKKGPGILVNTLGGIGKAAVGGPAIPIFVLTLAAKGAARFISIAMSQKDIPEIIRLNRALDTLAGAVALTGEGVVIAATREVGVILRVVHQGPKAALVFSRVVRDAARVVADAAQLAFIRGLMPQARALILAKFPEKIAQIETPAWSTSSHIEGLPDVAITIPNGSMSFTSPQSAMPTAVPTGPTWEMPSMQPLFFSALGAVEDASKSLVDAAGDALAASKAQFSRSFADMSDGGLSQAFADAQAEGASSAISASVNEDILQAPLWESLVAASRKATASIESAIATSLRSVVLVTRGFAVGFTTDTAQTLRPAQLATDSLNDALAMDVELIQKVTVDSVRGARIRQVVQMGALAVVAAIQSAVAVARGVALLVGGDIPKAILNFTAAGLYTAAGILAVSYGGAARGSGRRVGQFQEPERLGTVAELMVIVPGYADAARIRDEVAMAIDGTGAVGDGAQGFARSRDGAGSIAGQAFATYEAAWGGERGRNQLAGGLAGLYAFGGPLGWTAGVLAGRYGDQIGAEAGRVGRRVRRFGRRLGL